ncbi:MAG: DUF6264 family protein [Microbacterium sp.]
MTDDRPRYGEYATPEEQRRARGLPEQEDQQAALDRIAQRVVDDDRAAKADRRRPVDRLITIAMLAYGLVNVITTVPRFLDLPATLTQTLKILGVDGEFTNVGPARTWGIVAAVVLVVGYAVTVAFALRRLKTGRLAWWIPLAGFVATTFVISLCMVVPMMGDPAFLGATIPGS